jgi:tripartite-type tricarboxylate transporter receptor subunit TctC
MITLASTYSYVMSVPTATGIKSVAELVALGRTRDKPLIYGTPGIGSGPHLSIELLALQTKMKVQHIPFRGSAPAVTELIAGRLDFMMDPPASMMEFIRDGRLRALAVSSGARYFALPDTPTLAEAGIPGFDVTGWQGVVGPAGIPEPIVSRLNSEITRILKQPATIEKLHAFGNESAPGTPEAFKARIESDIAKWTTVVEQIHFEKI